MPGRREHRADSMVSMRRDESVTSCLWKKDLRCTPVVLDVPFYTYATPLSFSVPGHAFPCLLLNWR